jgi:hypothetical protein
MAEIVIINPRFDPLDQRGDGLGEEVPLVFVSSSRKHGAQEDNVSWTVVL